MYIFNDLKSKKLNRVEDLDYTLNDPSLDDFYGLNNEKTALIPSQGDIRRFAAATLLYGVVGWKVVDYTVVPAGIIATYSNGEDFETIQIEPSENYKALLESKYDAALFDSCTDDPIIDAASFGAFLLEEGYNTEEIAHNIKEACLCIYNPEKVFDRMIGSMQPFSNKQNSLRSRNWKYNQAVLEKVAADYFGFDYNNLTGEQMQKVNKKATEILDNFVLPCYFQFMGNSRNGKIERDINVLNEENNLRKLVKMVSNGKDEKNLQRANAVLKSCSTNFISEPVYDLMKTMLLEKNVTGKIKVMAPLTPYMSLANKMAADNLKKLTKLYENYVNEDELAD